MNTMRDTDDVTVMLGNDFILKTSRKVCFLDMFDVDDVVVFVVELDVVVSFNHIAEKNAMLLMDVG